MTRTFKVLGLVSTLVLAICGMGSSAASAASFTSASTPVTISMSQSLMHVLSVTNMRFTCTGTSFHGEIKSSPTESLTIKPTYTGCTTDTLGLNAKIAGFGHYGEEKTCDYVFQASGTLDLVCEAGAEIVITAGTCKANIPAQKGLGTITYSNGAADITANIEINSISGTHTDAFGCPFGGSGSFSNGTMSGASTITGSIEGKSVSLAWDK